MQDAYYSHDYVIMLFCLFYSAKTKILYQLY